MVDDIDLREEVKRLRDEQDRIRHEQDRLNQKTDSLAQPRQNGEQDRPKDQKGKESGDQDGKKDDPEKGKQDDGKKDDAKKDDGKKEDEEPKKKPGQWVREHPLSLVLILVLLVAAAIGGFFFYQHLASFEDTDDAEVDAHINAVTSRISGTVVGVYLEDNQSVKAGEVLVDLDPRDYKVSLEQVEAQLSEGQAGIQAQNPNIPITQTSQTTQVQNANQDVATARAGLSAAKQTYESSIAQLRQAEANYANAASDEVRYRLLVDKDEVSKEQYDEKLTQKLAQKALVDAQRASADASKDVIEQRNAALVQAEQRDREAQQNAPRSVEIQRAQLANRQAQVKANLAQVDQARLNLTYTKILAPVTGVVGHRSVEVGQQVSPGQQLMGVTNLEDIWVTANFKETQLQNMHPQQPVRIHVDAINADFDGYVESLPGATGAQYSLLPPENATGNYVKVVQRLPVRIRFKSGQAGLERLRPGMSVEPKVQIR